MTALTVRIKPPGAAWIVAGTEDQRGYVPEGLSASANESGPDTISFSLRRDPRVAFPDLQPFSPCELEVAGVVVWSGYVWQTPSSGPYTIGVAGRGWQYHLDEDQQLVNYVHATPGDYVDQRSIATSNLAIYTSVWPAPAQDAGIVLSIAGTPAVTVPISTQTGVTLDLGYACAKRISVDWESSNNDASITFYAACHDIPSETLAVNWNAAFSFALNTGASGTTSGTFAVPYRYVTLTLQASAAHVVPAAGVHLRIQGVRVYTATAYESGNQSILKASDVVKAELANAPLLQQGTSLIQSTSFSIPELAPRAYQTPRQRLTAVNAFHDWLLQVTPQRQVVYRPRPTVPIVETGSMGGWSFQDAALNSGEDVYNRVIVQATGPDGAALFSVRAIASSLLTTQGRIRTFVLNAGATLTQAAADALGDAWLTSRTRTPLKGSLEVASLEGVRTLAGMPVHPSLLLLYPGELIRLNDRVNPDTGGWARDGTIANVSYSHDAEKASLSIDSPRDRLESLLAQLGAVETAAGL